jgi:hypothetical protein
MGGLLQWRDYHKMFDKPKTGSHIVGDTVVDVVVVVIVIAHSPRDERHTTHDTSVRYVGRYLLST